LLLQAIVADGGGGVQRLVEIAGLEETAVVRRVRPDAREAVAWCSSFTERPSAPSCSERRAAWTSSLVPWRFCT
jgi:hypothetical protein